MQSLSNTRLLSALTLLVHVHVQVATVSAQTTPIWFPRVESEFDNDAFPLRRCNKRNNVAPTMGSECGPRSKTCFFGDKICESQTDGEPAFAYPQHSCTCNGMGSLGVWGCQVAPCPGAPTLPPSPPPTPAPVTPIPSSTPSTESPTDMAPTAAPITVAPTNNPSTSEPSASPSTSEPSASPSKTPSNIPTSSSPTLAPIPANAPIWYRRIENTFSSDKFPLRGCFSRNNIAPPADTMCGPTPKTCFFGDQICEGFNGEADFVFPVHSCVCDGMMTWVCQTTACPGAAAPPSTTTDSPSDAPSLTPPDATEAPVTGAPVVPDTMAPVTGAPVVPDTLAPVTGAPVTVAPVTPDTLAPVTGAPVGPDTLAPATGAPVTLAPIATATLAPVTGAPVVTLAPATIAPDTNAPVTGAPVLPDTLAPATAAPVTPGTLSPVTVAPVVTTIAPATGAPVGPDTLAPVTGAPIETLPPATTAPATTAPIDADTTPPATAAPATGAPFAPVSTVTQPPAVTDAPVTMAPAAITGAPVTFSPVKPVLPVPTETVAPTTHSPVLGQPIPTDSPVAPSSSNAPSQCQDATITETPWSDTDTDNCLTYELNSYCILYGDDSSIARFNLTANDACCTCGGGARDATNSSAACVDLLVPAETPIPWTDSARGNCSFYAEDPQTRCVNFASEFNAAFNLTVGEACCACAGITPPSPPTCTDLAGWNTASNRTCEQVTRQDCLFETENFGVSVGAACCKCGLREGDPSAPQSFFKATGAISAGGCTPNSANFDMCVKLAPNIAAIDFGIFQAARERWSGIITADSPDFEYDFQALNTTGFVTRQSPENATDLDDFYTRICGYDPLFSDNDNTDDVNICIDQRVLREGVIASSGPVFGDNFTRFGFVHINADEVSKARQRGTILADVVLHEIGHVLGIGLLWASTAPEQLNVDGTDCTYIGRNANRVYQEISGCSNTTTLPIEEPSIRNFNFADGSNLTITNCGTHLNEACFHNELMTSFVNADTLPLSTVTVAMLEDLGYSVDYSKADVFTKADLNASCVCDDPDPSLRLLMGEEPVRGEVPERPVLSMKGKRNVMAYAKEQLNRINEIAMSYMVNNDDGVAVGVPGITVMYVEDGEIYTEYIMNFDGEYTDEEDEEEEEEPIFGDAGSITRR